MAIRGPLMGNPTVQAGGLAETIGIASPGSYVISGFTATAGGTYVNVTYGKAFVGGTVVDSDSGTTVNSKPGGGLLVLRTRYDIDTAPWLEIIPKTAVVSTSGGFKTAAINRVPGVAYDLVLYQVDADSQGLISYIYDYAVRTSADVKTFSATNVKQGYTDLRPGSIITVGNAKKFWDGDKLLDAGQVVQYSWTALPTTGHTNVDVGYMKARTEGSVTTTVGQLTIKGATPKVNFTQSPGVAGSEMFIGMSIEKTPQAVKAVWTTTGNTADIKPVYGTTDLPSGTSVLVNMAVVR